MKKDHLRDYATHAFREYAAAGCPTYDQLRDKLIAEAMASSGERLNVKSGIIYKPTEAQIEAAQQRLDKAIGQLDDIVSVIRTMDQLRDLRDGDLIIRCLKIVYFAEPKRDLRRGEITDRVRYAAEVEHIDDSTVFRKLRTARKIFSTERKLNTGSSENIFKSCQ